MVSKNSYGDKEFIYGNILFVIIDILITLFSALFFLYIYWSRLKEDYTQNQIFTSGIYILIGIGAGRILANNFFDAWWFWAAFAGGLIGFIIGISRIHMKIIETLEAYVISVLALYLIVALSALIKTYSPETLVLFLGIALFIGLFLFLDRHYKKFTWYKSGKVGFSGLTVMGLFFLTRSVVAMSGLSVLSFAGDLEVVISGIIAFLSFMAVYNLSGKT